MELRTERLVLRRWEDADRAPFAALNADPAVMEFFPARLTSDESDALIDRIEHHFDTAGFGLWAVEERATGSSACRRQRSRPTSRRPWKSVGGSTGGSGVGASPPKRRALR